MELWHRASKAHTNSILDNGLIPRGTSRRRKAVHVAPVPPSDTSYKQNCLKTATTFVVLDPDLLVRHILFKTITLSTNGTVLVTRTIPADAFEERQGLHQCVLVGRCLQSHDGHRARRAFPYHDGRRHAQRPGEQQT